MAKAAPKPLRYLCIDARLEPADEWGAWWRRLVGNHEICGPGVDGRWNHGASIETNLRSLYGDLVDFDAVFLSPAFTVGDARGVTYRAPKRRFLGHKPTVAYLHETVDITALAPDVRRLPIADVSRVDILLHAYATAELDPLAVQVDFPRQRSQTRHIYLPHHVDTTLFAPRPEGDTARDMDLLLVDHAPARLHSLRQRFAALLGTGIAGNAVHLPPSDKDFWWSAWGHSNQLAPLIDHLQRAHIVLFCASHWRYNLPLFAQAAAAGAFIISDVAADLPHAFIDNMGVVAADMSDGQLAGVLAMWINATTERQTRTARLRAYVREHLSMGQFWTKVDAAVRAWHASTYAPTSYV